MIPLMVALMGTAQAADWGEPKPYLQPRLNIGGVAVNGVWHAQAIGGADVGVTVRDKDTPHWLSLTRIGATGMYGITSGSLGGDFRLGSFFGPDGKVARLLSGPDIFYNGYGDPTAEDYYLAWSPGLDIRNTVVFKIAKEFKLLGHVIPGWAFNPNRAAPDVPVFTHVNLGTSVVIKGGSFRLQIGVERQINAAGTQDYIVLGAGI